MSRSSVARLLVAVGAVALLAGCVRGQRLVSASHAAYNDALRERMDEELLLNLVRLRYRDRPLFLQVSSVIARFVRQTGVSAGAGGGGGDGGAWDGSGQVGLSYSYSEQPTVTFTPLQGEDFAERLLRPVDLETIALLQRSGWSIERVLRLTVQRMNDLDNASSASGPTPAKAPGFRRFVEVTRALKQLQDQRAVVIGSESATSTLSEPLAAEALTPADVLVAAREGQRFEAGDAAGTIVLRSSRSGFVLRLASAQEGSDATGSLRRHLGLRPDADSYSMLPAVGAVEDILGPTGERDRVVLVTRSLLGVFFFLSHAVEIPPEHVGEGLVTATVDESGAPFDWSEVTEGLLSIRSSRSRPEGAAVAVPYRGSWYYIAEDDLTSKSTFALLAQLYALQAGEVVGGGPVPTIPIGG